MQCSTAKCDLCVLVFADAACTCMECVSLSACPAQCVQLVQHNVFSSCQDMLNALRVGPPLLAAFVQDLARPLGFPPQLAELTPYFHWLTFSTSCYSPNTVTPQAAHPNLFAALSLKKPTPIFFFPMPLLSHRPWRTVTVLLSASNFVGQPTMRTVRCRPRTLPAVEQTW